jgi:hypothetical protein
MTLKGRISLWFTPLLLAGIASASCISGQTTQIRFTGSTLVQDKSQLTENHYFNLGNRDGYREYKGKHVKRIDVFPNDNVKYAYDEGYEEGIKGKRACRIDRRQSKWAIVRSPSGRIKP